jgi:hypothetical protein
MLSIRQSTVLLRIPAGLAIRLKATEHNEHDGWNAIPDHDGRSSDKAAQGFESQLLPGDRRLFVSGIGNTSRGARARTLTLALGRVSHALGDLTVEFVRVRRYPWFFLSTLVINPTSVPCATTQPPPFDESSV